MNEIEKKVDELVKWDNLLKECKEVIEKLKNEFETLATEKIKDTKLKQISFTGTNGSKVTVTSAENVSVTYNSFIKKVLGVAFDDVATEKNDYTYTAAFKEVLKSLYNANYLNDTVDHVLRQAVKDEKSIETLKKKLRGKWDKDIQNLKSIGKLTQDEAEHYEYFIIDVLNYEKIKAILEAAGHKEGTVGFEVAVQTLINAVEIKDVLKVSIES